MTRPEHPSFVKPENRNARLWRYMSADRLQWMLQNGRLYMARASQMQANDPREGTMPDGQAAWWQQQILQSSDDEVRTRITENFEKVQGFVKMFRRSWFISCWHMRESENFAFWRIYGRGESKCARCDQTITYSGRAVAITTTFQKLEDTLPIHVLAGQVRYLNYATDRGGISNMYDYIMSKRHFYEYECEVRAVASDWFSGDSFKQSDMINGSYAPFIQISNLIGSVVVHPEASKEFFGEVQQLCVEYNLPRPVLSGLAY